MERNGEIMINPIAPDLDWMQSYFNETLTKAKAYHIDTPNVRYKLDQNETPWDWPQEFKDRVAARVALKQWNRYPTAFANDLNVALARSLDIPPNCIMTANGSNVLLSLIISTLTQKITGRVIIARPSFALYESHCQYSGIPYDVWQLNSDFDFDVRQLPKFPSGSLVIFASPNNPVGNAISYDALDSMLKAHPQSYFLVDEAYFEFVEKPFLPLLSKHANLILVRTFSKTMGAAGVRIGYAVAAEPLIRELSKQRLPYLLNFYALEAAQELLQNPALEQERLRTVRFILEAREAMTQGLTSIANGRFFVKRSHANFIMLRWDSQSECNRVYEGLIRAGILVRNISGAPGLAGCLRVTIGTAEENSAFMTAMRDLAA
jgi:histidinol-phosphate aminotransferase